MLKNRKKVWKILNKFFINEIVEKFRKNIKKCVNFLKKFLENFRIIN